MRSLFSGDRSTPTIILATSTITPMNIVMCFPLGTLVGTLAGLLAGLVCSKNEAYGDA